ncbi:large ribosomal subunit protein bL27-like [Physella acuta]|uniref:large ribosomal subunit protein bL27-like n=1 Tax=Physella acuta TaxID=109671 RepID=UPI0027DDD4F8|nr:large ribosomal subunit protein bL27-like [Physella acuta]
MSLSQLFTSWKLPSAAVTLLKALPALNNQPVRFAAKKAGGTVRNPIGRTKRKHRGIKAHDGQFVHKGSVIATQYGIRFYPGENVTMDNDWTLRAAYDGIVVHTSEVLNPYPDSPLYDPVQKGTSMVQEK